MCITAAFEEENGCTLSTMESCIPKIETLAKLVNNVQTFTVAHIVSYIVNHAIVAGFELRQQLVVVTDSDLHLQYFSFNNYLIILFLSCLH